MKKKFEVLFSYKNYFYLHMKLRFIPIGLVMRKLWTILFFKQFKHLFKKCIRFISDCNIYNFPKKVV